MHDPRENQALGCDNVFAGRSLDEYGRYTMLDLTIAFILDKTICQNIILG
jgi:hypothetical protein